MDGQEDLFRTLANYLLFQGLSMRSVTIVALLCATAAAVPAQGTGRIPVTPSGMAISATLSPGIRIGDMVYVSGQLPSKPGTREPLDSTIQGQTKQALENVKAVVEAAGTTMANVVKCTVFLVDVKDFAGMN